MEEIVSKLKEIDFDESEAILIAAKLVEGGCTTASKLKNLKKDMIIDMGITKPYEIHMLLTLAGILNGEPPQKRVKSDRPLVDKQRRERKEKLRLVRGGRKASTGTVTTTTTTKSGRSSSSLHTVHLTTKKSSMSVRSRQTSKPFASISSGGGAAFTPHQQDIASYKLMKTFDIPSPVVCFDSTGTTLASCSSNTIRLYDVGRGLTRKTIFGSSNDVITSMSFHPRYSSFLATASFPGFSGAFVHIWDVELASIVRKIKPISASQANEDTTCPQICFHPEGATIATANTNGVELWSVETSELVTTFQNPNNSFINAFRFSSSGCLLAAGTNKGKVSMWDVERTVSLKSFVFHPTTVVYSVNFNSCNEFIIGVGLGRAKPSAKGGMIRIRDIRDRNDGIKIEGHSGAITCLDFHPNGSMLLTGSGNTTVKLWDIRHSASCLQVLGGHMAQVASVSFDATGDWLASSSAARSSNPAIKLWHIL